MSLVIAFLPINRTCQNAGMYTDTKRPSGSGLSRKTPVDGFSSKGGHMTPEQDGSENNSGCGKGAFVPGLLLKKSA
jgi:hypothetical protein